MGLKVTVRSVGLKPALSRLTGPAKADAIEALSREIEVDIQPYVKRDTGTLMDSPRAASDYRAGKIVWTAQKDGKEYAGHAYDDPNVGRHEGQFWSSGILTGNQTSDYGKAYDYGFWSSGILTGNQTGFRVSLPRRASFRA